VSKKKHRGAVFFQSDTPQNKEYAKPPLGWRRQATMWLGRKANDDRTKNKTNGENRRFSTLDFLHFSMINGRSGFSVPLPFLFGYA
jgi:hypothetical protein